MSPNVKFRDLRRLLLDVGFHEFTTASEIVFRHEPSDTLFVFRAYRPGDPVASYNLIEVQKMLDSRGLMAAGTFASQFQRTSA